MTTLAAAFQRGELRLAWLPIVDLGSGRVSGVEALLRLDGPERARPLDVLVADAERAGDMGAVGRWVLTTALREVAAYPEPLRLSVNVSEAELLDADLPGALAAALAASGHPAELVHLEISERSLTAGTRDVVQAMTALRQHGVRLSIDDFGTGMSSLTQLQALPVDELKIDRTFVARMHEDGRSAAIVRGVVSLARSLRLSLLAEGVELATQERMLLGLRCTSAQGWLYARPQSSVAAAVASVDAAAVRARTGSGAALWSNLGSDPVAARIVEAAFTGGSIGMALIDGTGTHLAVNPALSALLDVPAADLVGGSCWDAVHPDDVARDQALLDAVLRGERDGYVLEQRLVAPGRGEHWVEVTVGGAPVDDADERGATMRLLRQVRSIEDRREAAARQAMLAAVVDASADAIVIGGVDGTVTHWNPAAETLSGRLAAEAVGSSAAVVLAPAIAQHIAGGEAVRLADSTLEVADGSHVPVDATLSPIAPDGGDPTAFVAILRDMREQRAAAERLEQLNRELADQASYLVDANGRLSFLASTLTHDLQQPLAALGGFLHLLANHRAEALDADGKEWLDAASRTFRRLTEAVEALARTALGAPVELEIVDLEAVFTEAVEDLSSVLRSAGATVHVGALPLVYGDRAMLVRVATNLLANSARYRDPDRSARIEVRRRPSPPGRAVIEIADNGRGFDPTEVESVFRGGHRGRAAAGTDGTGTGLAIVRSAIAALDGQVWAEPRAPHGAAVCFALTELAEAASA